MGIFSRPKPPNDNELYLNVSLSLHLYLDSLADLQMERDPLGEAIEMDDSEYLQCYEIITNTALSNLNYAKNQNFKDSILMKIPNRFSSLKTTLSQESYLPPPIPPRYTSWIQGLLNEAFPIERKFEDFDFGLLWYLLTQAFMQGNPPRKEAELTQFENKFIEFLATSTILGLRQAASIESRREKANRHLAQLLILSMILGLKFSMANNLEASD